MRPIETTSAGLPVTIDVSARRYTKRESPQATFLSQLIAERHNLAAQRAKRRAPVDDVVRTYDAGGKISERRLPPGYRMSIEA